MVVERFKPFLNLSIFIISMICLALIEFTTHLFSNMFTYLNLINDPMVRFIISIIPLLAICFWLLIIIFQFKESGFLD